MAWGKEGKREKRGSWVLERWSLELGRSSPALMAGRQGDREREGREERNEDVSGFGKWQPVNGLLNFFFFNGSKKTI